MIASRDCGEGFATAEYLAAALLDLTWQALPDGAETREALRLAILSRGGSVDLIEATTLLLGRVPEIGPLLARRGLTTVAAAAATPS